MKNQTSNLDLILDRCVTAVVERGQSVQTCLNEHEEQREKLEPLLNLAVSLQSVRSVQPSSEFQRVAAVRMQNLLAAHPRVVQGGTNTSTAKGRPQNWLDSLRVPRLRLSILISTLMMAFGLLLGGSVIVVADNTLPGQALYPVKRAVENTQLAWTLDKEYDARLHLRMADRRMEEAATLIAANQPESASEAIQSMTEHIRAVIEIIEEEQGLSVAQRELVANALLNRLTAIDVQLITWQANATSEIIQAVIARALGVSGDGLSAIKEVLGKLPETGLILPIQTETPQPTNTASPVPSATATITPTPPPPSPTPTSTPVTPASSSTSLPAKDTPSERIEDCHILGRISEDCIRPRVWPTIVSSIPLVTPPIPPIDWPEDCPLPSEWPTDWPEGCPLPSDWPDFPDDWTPPPWPDGSGEIEIPPHLPTPPFPLPDLPGDGSQLPDIPEVPDVPDVPEELPQPPDVPDLPDELPQPPDLPDLPDELPQPPDLPDLPGGDTQPSGGSWPTWP